MFWPQSLTPTRDVIFPRCLQSLAFQNCILESRIKVSPQNIWAYSLFASFFPMASQSMCFVNPLRISARLCIVVRETSKVTMCMSRCRGATPHLLAACNKSCCALQVHAGCVWFVSNMRNSHETRRFKEFDPAR